MNFNNKSSFKYYIDESKVERTYQGDLVEDYDDQLLLSKDNNLLENLIENKNGYLVKDIFDINLMTQLNNSLFEFLSNKFEIEINNKNFNKILINMDDKTFHQKMKRIYKGIEFNYLPFSIDFLEDWASKSLKQQVKLFYINSPSLLIRIVRPFSVDFNPPHKDIYIDRLRNAANCFLPLLGVNKNSSLPIVPSSHLWKESNTIRTQINPFIVGLRFSVPAIISLKDSYPLVLTRPKVKYGQVMIFSPYCIHGGAKNFSTQTRISFEFRFKKK